MKRLFFTGLITLLPLAVTLLVVSFVLTVLTAPFQDLIANFLATYGLLDRPFLFLSGKQVLNISSSIMAMALLFGLILGIGFLARTVIVKGIINYATSLIQHIPFVNKIYNLMQDSVSSVFGPKSTSFSQAVLVPFPHEDAYSLGLVAKMQTPEKHDDKIFVFIPGTPNPTAAYMISFRYEQIEFLDMKVEDAIKTIISCGIMFPGFKRQ